jgi:hypothetical protein
MAKGKKTGGGHRRNKADIKKFKLEILNLISQGLTKKRIIEVFTSKNEIPENTFYRYWKELSTELDEEIKQKMNEELNHIILRSNRRREECAINYFKEKTTDWIKEWRTEEFDSAKFFQSVGLLKKIPDEINMAVSSETDLKIDEVYEKFRTNIKKKNKNT